MTFNTGNPIGSTDARDLSDNAENFDKALGTLDATWTDRLGVTRDSFEGRLAKGSFYRVGTFAAGYTLTNMRQTLEYSGHEYSWAGTFPKVVAAGATPATSGGIGAGAWVDRTDFTLRTELSLNNGAHLVGNSAFYTEDILNVDVTNIPDKAIITARTRNGAIAGGGVFEYLSGSTATVDNGIIFGPTNGTGRLVRLNQGVITPEMLGADNTGVADCSDIFYEAPCPLIINSGVFLINVSGTIYQRVSIGGNSEIIIASGATVNFAGGICINDNLPHITLTDTTSLVRCPHTSVDLGWFTNTSESFSWHAIINDLIGQAPVQGRQIHVPTGLRRYLSAPINLQGKNYIRIYGDNAGVRSNIEYEKSPPAGSGTSTIWPGGGSMFILDTALSYGIYQGPQTISNYRSSGVTVEGLTISGNKNRTVTQSGIYITGDNDGFSILNNTIINMSGYCIYAAAADTMRIKGNWCSESVRGLFMTGSKECSIIGNSFGGKPTGVTCDIQLSVRIAFVGNNVFPDGYTAVNLYNVRFSCFTGNVITGRFTGLVTLFLSYLNTFNDNVLRVPNDEVTDWTAGKSAWSTTNYDPKNRDIYYGVVYVFNASNDNTFIGNSISGYISGSNPVLVRIGGTCNRNTFSSCRTATGVTSTLKWAIESGATNNALIYCDVAGQINDAGTGTLKTYLNG